MIELERRVLKNPHDLASWRDLLPALESRAPNINGRIESDFAAYVKNAIDAIERTSDGDGGGGGTRRAASLSRPWQGVGCL